MPVPRQVSAASRLRMALPGDAEAIAAQGRTAFVEAFGAHYPARDIEAYCRETYGPGAQARELAEDGTTIFLAEDDQGIAGHLKLGPLGLPAAEPAGRAAEIKRLYFLSRAHGQGLAPALLALALRRAAEGGADCVYLSCWTENHRAFRFYRREGFVVVGRHPFRTGETIDEDHVMRRPLP